MLAQLVEQDAFNVKVIGSNPIRPTTAVLSSMDRMPCFELGDVGSIPAGPAKIHGVHSVEVRTLVCETGSMGSFPIGHPMLMWHSR